MAESQRLINHALSDNSYKAYNTALHKFNSFAQSYNIPIHWPLPSNVILNFIAHLSLLNMSPNTVRLYIRALSYFHKVRQVSDPTTSFLITKALQGLTRCNSAPDTRHPITLAILEKLLAALPSVCTSSYESKLFACAFSLAYFGLLRIGEFTISNLSLARNSHCLQSQNVILNQTTSQVSLTIPHSKTDQTGKKNHSSHFVSGPHHRLPSGPYSQFFSHPATYTQHLFFHPQ